MMKLVVGWLVFLTSISQIAWSMEHRLEFEFSPFVQPQVPKAPETTHSSRRPTIAPLTINWPAGYWKFIQTLWSVMFVQQQKLGLHFSGMTKEEILVEAQRHIVASFGKSINEVRVDQALIEQLLNQPEKIFFKREGMIAEVKTGVTELRFKYSFQENEMVAWHVVMQKIRIGDSDEVWKPLESSIRYILATDETQVLKTWIRHGLNIDYCFTDFGNATMLHLAAMNAPSHVSEFLVDLGAHCDVVDGQGKTALSYLQLFNRTAAIEKCKNMPPFNTLMNFTLSRSSTRDLSGIFVPPMIQPTPPMVPQMAAQTASPVLPLSQTSNFERRNAVLFEKSPLDLPNDDETSTSRPGSFTYEKSPFLYYDNGKSFSGLPFQLTREQSSLGAWNANIYQAAPSQFPDRNGAAFQQVPAITNSSAAPIAMYLNPKYVPIQEVASPIARTSDEIESADKPTPILKLNSLPMYTGETYQVSKYLDGVLHYRLLSAHPVMRPIDYERTTFILAGRGQQAYVPEESAGGRVILVVTPEDAFANLWVNEHRDVMIIDALWDQQGHRIRDFDLRLVTSRRLAVFYLARHYRLPHMMMLDDNIQEFYASNNLAHVPSTWAQIYDLFRATALENQSSVLSLQALSHRMMRVSLNSSSVLVNKHSQASKVYFFNWNAITNVLRTPIALAWLFPLKLDVCGEDIFFQNALSYLNLSVDTFSVRTLAYARHSGNKNAALNTIAPATYWKTPQALPPHAPSYHCYASTRMMEILDDNIERMHQKNQERQQANIAQLTAYYNAIRKAKRDQELSKEMTPFLYTSPVVGEKRKRQTPVNYRRPGPGPILVAPPIINNNNLIPHMVTNLATNLKQTIDQIFLTTPLLYDTRYGVPFRAHQLTAVNRLRAHLDQGRKSGYFELPTGAGKTRLFLALLAFALKAEYVKGKHIAILIPSLDLVDQTYEAIDIFNQVMRPFGLAIPREKVVSKISSNDVPQNHLQFNHEFNQQKPQVLIFCNKSFENMMKERPDFYDRFSMIIVDEFHAAPKAMLAQISQKASERDLLFFGFSATPEKKDKYFGSPISFLSVEDAVAQKVLVPWKNMSLGAWKKNDQTKWHRLARAFGSVQHPNRQLLKDTKTLIYVSNVAEANALAYWFSLEGMKAEAYTYQRSKEDQKKLIARFALRDNSPEQLNVLIAINMLCMGFDAHVETVVFARRGSFPTVVQARGRELRPDPLDPDKEALFMAPQEMFLNFDLRAPYDGDGEVIPMLMQEVVHDNHDNGKKEELEEEEGEQEEHEKRFDLSPYFVDM